MALAVCGRGVVAGKSAVKPITRFDAAAFRSQVAAEISDFDPLDYMDYRTARRLDRFAQLGVAVARQALEDSGLDLAGLNVRRAGVSLGSALGGVPHAEDQHERYLQDGLKAVGPMLALAVYGGASGANVAIEFNLRGPNLAHASSCASGAVAIGEAMRLIERDEADIMIAGGVEAPLAPLTYGAFSLIKAMSTRNNDPAHASRPFDAQRDGFVMAEGGAVMVLEEYERARRRGARMYGEVAGYGQSNDAYHMTAPRPDGGEAAHAIQLALLDAGVSPQGIGYVNAHATGTPLGDAAETCALEGGLGEHGRRVPVSGTKGLYGHALGASGAIEAGISALALTHSWVPGTLNLDNPDEVCRLNHVPASGMSLELEYALSTSFGFGGVNGALVLKRA